MAIRVQLPNNRFGYVRRETPRRLQARLNVAANELREALQSGLGSGLLPIQSDTAALASSLTVQTPSGSDRAARIADAYGNYTAGSDKYGPYSGTHFTARLDPVEEPLPSSAAVAGVYTPLGYGNWWEHGHYNPMTRRDEAPRPWMYPTSVEWAQANLAMQFAVLFP